MLMNDDHKTARDARDEHRQVRDLPAAPQKGDE
jgi:hypothetical protein